MHEKLKEVTRKIGVKRKIGQEQHIEAVLFPRQGGNRTGLQKNTGTARQPLDNLED